MSDTNKNTLPLEELYTGSSFVMNDDLTMEEIMEYEENERIRSAKLKEIKKFLQECSLEDFVYVIIKIFKDKTPVINVFNDVIYNVEYTRRKRDDFSTIRGEEIKEFKFEHNLEIGNWYYKNLLFTFAYPQNINTLLISIEECLKGKSFSLEGLDGDKIVIKDCPIAEVEITPEYFKLIINPDKTTIYNKREPIS